MDRWLAGKAQIDAPSTGTNSVIHMASDATRAYGYDHGINTNTFVNLGHAIAKASCLFQKSLFMFNSVILKQRLHLQGGHWSWKKEDISSAVSGSENRRQIHGEITGFSARHFPPRSILCITRKSNHRIEISFPVTCLAGPCRWIGTLL